MEETRIEDARAEDLEEIDTIIAELEISKGRGNLILCVVNAPAYRDGIIRVLKDRFSSKVILVKEGGDVIQSLKSEDFGGAEVLIWTMPEKLTEDLADALNNFRELFYDAGISSLVFLSQSFLDDVIRKAPDFWRYRGNYYELKGRDRGTAFEAIDALATSLHYQNKEDLLRRKRINEYILEKVTDEREIAKILNELGHISYNLGAYDNASKYFKQELCLSEKLGDKGGVARPLILLGWLALETGDMAEAHRLFGEGLKLFQDMNYKRGVSSSLHNLGSLALAIGDLAEARRFFGESLKLFQDMNYKRGVSSSLHNLGSLALAAGDVADAHRLFGESLKIAQELGDKSIISRSLFHLGMLAQDRGEISEARRFYGESLKIAQELGDKSIVAITLAQFAHLEEGEGYLERALDLIRQAEALFLELGSPRAEGTRIDRVWLEYKIANE